MHFEISLPLWELLEISLKTKRWLYVIISRTCFRVDLHLTECQRTPCWKQARSLSDSYGIQNLAKWLRVHLPTKWFWFESHCCHTINMKKHLDPQQGSYFGHWALFFQYSLKHSDTAAMNRKKEYSWSINGISFFNIYKILLCQFILRSMKSIEM